MRCGHCRRDIVRATGEKINTRDVCPHCDADLHTCDNCRHFDPGSRFECREPMAEWVRRKDRNNYCDYFSAKPVAGAQPSELGESARESFDRLFKG